MRLWVPKVTRLTLALVVVALALASALVPDASAHHSTAYFLKDKKITVKGQVSRFEWRSPHTTIFVETKEPSGEVVVWRIETNYTAGLVREGWTKDSLKVGDQLTADVYAVADPKARYAWLVIATKADGTILRTSESSLTRAQGNLPPP